MNCNIWITPDDAVDDGGGGGGRGGGLIVYKRKAPSDWDFNTYNEVRKGPELQRWARSGGNVTVPYKQNRLVMFDSDLLHETAPIRFKRGYSKRRINITLLFGSACGNQRHPNSKQ